MTDDQFLSDYLSVVRDALKAHMDRNVKLNRRQWDELVSRVNTLVELAKDMEEDLRIHQHAAKARLDQFRNQKAQADITDIIQTPGSNVTRLKIGSKHLYFEGPDHGGDAA